MKSKISTIIMCLALSACGKPKTTPETENQVLQEQESLLTDYSYKVMDDCSKENPRYRYIGVADIVLPGLKDDKEVVALIYIFIEPNGSYSYEYEERQILKRLSNGYSYSVILSQNYIGQWRSQGKTLVLEGLGVIEEVVFNDSLILMIRLTNDIRHGSGIKSRITTAYQVFSPQGKTMSANICH